MLPSIQGNSGGALIDMDGKLIGINTAKISSTDVEESDMQSLFLKF